MDVSVPYINAPLVDWNAGQLLPAPRKMRPNRRETFFPTTCPQCQSVRWLRRSAAQKAEIDQRRCRRCQASSAGKLGWAATSARYGADFTRKVSQRHQLLHPSRPEALVDHLLFALGASYDRQVEYSAQDEHGLCHTFYLDFVLHTPDGLLPLEINGYWHKRRCQERDRALAELWTGLPVAFLDADMIIGDLQGTEARLRALLSGK